MAIEFETQVLDIDSEQIKQKLRELGAVEEPESLQKRWIFDIECLNSDSPGKGIWIRLRESNGKSTLTYKNRGGIGIGQTEEIESGVEDFHKISEIMSKLGCFSGIYYQENKRHKFLLNDIEFCIDSWPKIPAFLEVESSSEEKVKEGLRLLGLEGKDVGNLGLISVYKKHGIDLHSIENLKFEKK